MREAGFGVPVVVKEGVHTLIFESNIQRLRYFGKLHLSVPTDLNAFCAAGSHALTFAVVEVKEEQNINETITKEDPIIQKL